MNSPAKERPALLYFLEKINGAPLDFIQLAIKLIDREEREERGQVYV